MTGDKLTNSYKLFLETRVTVSMSVRGSRSLGVGMECRVRCLLQSCISMQSYSGYKAGVEPVLCSDHPGHTTSLLSTEC